MFVGHLRSSHWLNHTLKPCWEPCHNTWVARNRNGVCYQQWKMLSESNRGGWGEGEGSITGQGKAEASPRPQKDRASLVSFGQNTVWNCVPAPPKHTPTGVNGPKRFLSLCQVKNWFRFQGGDSINPTWGLRSPLSRWFRCNYKMDVAPSKKTTIHSCFPLKIVSAEIFMGRIFQQLYTEDGNSYVSFPQTWFLGGIFMLISLMLESFRRKIGSERALTNYNCPVF